MQLYTQSLTEYKRLATLEVKVGDLLLGNFNPIRIQTMTTTDTMDTIATVEQSIRCIEAGSELIRITAPSKNEAENLLNIKRRSLLIYISHLTLQRLLHALLKKFVLTLVIM
jgi:(E)-4-hydroxy-3-methylbut-2-enyl-diphosphate synthase